MPITSRVTVRPDRDGGFATESFAELVGAHIALPGLDPRYIHTLVGVAVADDHNSAELTVSSEPPHAADVTATLRIVNGSPPAMVRVLDTNGAVLSAGPLPCPLQPGQEIAIGSDHYRVISEAWPNRHPDAGAVQGDELDWQHATVTPSGRHAAVPTPA